MLQNNHITILVAVIGIFLLILLYQFWVKPRMQKKERPTEDVTTLGLLDSMRASREMSHQLVHQKEPLSADVYLARRQEIAGELPQYVVFKEAIDDLRKTAIDEKWTLQKYADDVFWMLTQVLGEHELLDFDIIEEHKYLSLTTGIGSIYSYSQEARNTGSCQVILGALDRFLSRYAGIRNIHSTVSAGRDKYVHFNDRSDAMVTAVLTFFSGAARRLSDVTYRKLRQEFQTQVIEGVYAKSFCQLVKAASERHAREKNDLIRRNRTRRGKRVRNGGRKNT